MRCPAATPTTVLVAMIGFFAADLPRVDASTVAEPECEGAAGCCSPMCSISGGEPCPGIGQTCEPVFDPQPQGFEDVGVCLLAGP